MGLIADLEDGKKREITERDYWYFLEVLPPVAMRFAWNGERWNFGFAEGADFMYALKQQGGRFYAQKTPFLNPNECGRSIEEQQAARSGRERTP